MPYTVIPTAIPDVLLLEPKVFGDDRGFFFESFNERNFRETTGVDTTFVQDNHSKVRVVQGRVFDAVVDLRRSSPTFGRSMGVVLDAESHRQLWVPPGFAHGFVVLSDSAEFLYKTTDYWYPEHERSLLWNDPALGIDWPVDFEPQLAAKDAAGKLLKDADLFD
jgi:dTDP-4-dehydrorhamnose 3,5-epimerase